MKTIKSPIRIMFVICALQLLLQNAHGEIWKSQEFNCEITLPSSNGWASINLATATAKVAAQNKDKGETILLLVVDAPANAQTLEQFVPGFKKGLFEAGGDSRDQHEESLTIDGRPAYGLSDTATIKGNDFKRTHLVVIDVGKVYQLIAMSQSGNPLDDSDIENAFKSFHFLGQAPAAPPSTQVHTDTNNLPLVIGRITGFALILILAVGLIVKFAKR